MAQKLDPFYTTIIVLALFLIGFGIWAAGYTTGLNTAARIQCEENGYEWLNERGDSPHPYDQSFPRVEVGVTCIEPIEKVGFP